MFLAVALASAVSVSSAVAQTHHQNHRKREMISSARQQSNNDSGQTTNSATQIQTKDGRLILYGQSYRIEKRVNPLTDKEEDCVVYTNPLGRDDYEWIRTIRDVKGKVVVQDGNHRILAVIAAIKAGTMNPNTVVAKYEDKDITAREVVDMYDQGLLISANAPQGYSGFQPTDVKGKFENWTDINEQEKPAKMRNADPSSPFDASRAALKGLLSDDSKYRYWTAEKYINSLINN
jgi:hypothetical protein